MVVVDIVGRVDIVGSVGEDGELEHGMPPRYCLAIDVHEFRGGSVNVEMSVDLLYSAFPLFCVLCLLIQLSLLLVVSVIVIIVFIVLIIVLIGC